MLNFAYLGTFSILKLSGLLLKYEVHLDSLLNFITSQMKHLESEFAKISKNEKDVPGRNSYILQNVSVKFTSNKPVTTILRSIDEIFPSDTPYVNCTTWASCFQIYV